MVSARRIRRSHTGVTLVELTISIVVIALAVVGVLPLLSTLTRHSADPMIQHQAVAIAEAYLEEVMLLPFDELAASGTAEGPLGIDAGETGRGLYDDVNDYIAHTDVGARSLSNPAAVIPGLDQYTVSVVVQNDPNLVAGALAVPNAAAELVTVQVSHPDGVNVVLAGYRTRY